MESKRKERRRSVRYLCSHLLQAACAGVSGTVLLEDVSTEGAALASERRVEAGVTLELTTPLGPLRAEVRYCLRRETDFRLGLLFQDGFQWNPAAWRPDHLWIPPLIQPANQSPED